MKRVSRVVQYVLSSDEVGNGEPACAEVPHTSGVGLGVSPETDRDADLISHSERVYDTGATLPSSAPFASSSASVQGLATSTDKSVPSVPLTCADT